MCSDALGATSDMRTCASDCSFLLLGVIASLLTVSAFLQKNDRLTIQTNRFLAQIHEDFIVYGITQDCRVFFVDRSNLDLIKALRVDSRNTYCYPNLVKLHLQQGAHRLALMLIMKQAGNRICTLPIEMPELHTISNGRIFSYSILSSVPYMSCSHLPDNSFALEPDISFMDTAFADVIYFINAKSIGSTWSVRRFQITKNGHLRAMDKLSINYPRRDDGIGYDMANQFIVELDLKRSLLYTMNRFLKNLLSECSFDLLFRPEYVQPKWIAFDRDQRRQTWLDSFSVDGDLLLFTESIREESGITANIYATNLLQPNSTVHILIVNFAADLIVLKKRTIVDLTARNVSRFVRARDQSHVNYSIDVQRCNAQLMEIAEQKTGDSNILMPNAERKKDWGDVIWLSSPDKSLARKVLQTKMITSTQTTTTTTTPPPKTTKTPPPTTTTPTTVSTKRPYATRNRSKTLKPFNERMHYEKFEPTHGHTTYNTPSTTHYTFTTIRTRLTTTSSESYTTKMAQDTEEDVYYRRQTSTQSPTSSHLPSTIIRQTILSPTMNINTSTMARFDHSEKTDGSSREVEGAVIRSSAGRERDAVSSVDDQLRRHSFNDHRQLSLEKEDGSKSSSVADRRLIDETEREESDSAKGWNEEDKEDEEKENRKEEEEENVYQLPQHIEKDEENIRKNIRPTKHPREQTGEPQIPPFNDTLNTASQCSVANIRIFVFPFLIMLFIKNFIGNVMIG